MQSATGFPIKAVFDGPPGECLRPDRNKIFHGHGIHRLAMYSAEPGNGARPGCHDDDGSMAIVTEAPFGPWRR